MRSLSLGLWQHPIGMVDKLLPASLFRSLLFRHGKKIHTHTHTLAKGFVSHSHPRAFSSTQIWTLSTLWPGPSVSGQQCFQRPWWKGRRPCPSNQIPRSRATCSGWPNPPSCWRRPSSTWLTTRTTPNWPPGQCRSSPSCWPTMIRYLFKVTLKKETANRSLRLDSWVSYICFRPPGRRQQGGYDREPADAQGGESAGAGAVPGHGGRCGASYDDGRGHGDGPLHRQRSPQPVAPEGGATGHLQVWRDTSASSHAKVASSALFAGETMFKGPECKIFMLVKV